MTSLANQPATSQQRRLVVLVAALQVVAFGFAAPFAHIPLAQVNAFIPTLEGIIFVNDIITSIFLFAQYSIFPSRAILVLAAGYLFTALIVIPHALTFPGAFAPTGLLNAGLQSTSWLYNFWHIGIPASVFLYASLKDVSFSSTVRQRSTIWAIVWCVGPLSA